MRSSELAPDLGEENPSRVQQMLFKIGGSVLHHLDTKRREAFQQHLTEALDHVTLQDSVSFVQIGAYDGDYDDPLSAYIQQPHWQGVLVEPQPDMALQLRKRYHYRPNIDIWQTAISESDGFLELWRPQLSGSPEAAALTSTELSRTRRSLWRLLGPAAVKKAEFETILAASTTLRHLLEESGVEDIDVFSTDTEGCDDTIMHSALDIVRPTVVLFEHRHMERKQYRDITQRLKRVGYRTTRSHKDTLAVVQ